MKRQMKRQMRGIMSFLLFFMAVVIAMLFYFFIANPIMLDFLTSSANAGSDIIGDITVSIQNQTLNQSFHTILNDAQTSLSNSASIVRYDIKYAWLIFVAAVTFMIFIAARKFIETGPNMGGGLV